MLKSIAKQWRASTAARGSKDRLLIFLIGIHAGLGEHRRWTRRAFHWLIGHFAEGQRVPVHFDCAGQCSTIFMRKGDRADYLVVGELIQGGYAPPPSPPSRIIDAGGNIGAFTLAASALFPETPIIVYEPDPANFAMLAHNLRVNGIEAQLIMKGVWSSDTTLYFQARDSYSGFVSGESSDTPVQCVVPDVTPGDWLKLDVEGAEYEVLPALFSRGIFPYFVSMELHFRTQKGDELIALARNNGYLVSGPVELDTDCVTLTLSRS